MTTNREIKDVSAKLYLFTAGFMIAALWGWWLLESQTDFRLGSRGSRTKAEAISYLYPMIATPMIFLGSIAWWRRSVGIAANGILVDAVIEKLSGARSGMRDVTITFIVDCNSYKVKKSFSEIEIHEKRVGDLIQIVADKRNPKRIILNT